MSQKNIPVFNLNTPNGGHQMPVTIPVGQPIHSVYTGNQVGVGFIPFGTPGDAPPGHLNYGMNFHCITFNPVNNSYMVHDSNRWR